MEGVGPALGKQGNSCGPRILCVGTHSLDPEFLNRVEPGLNPGDAATKAIHDGNTVNQHLCRPDLHAIDSGIASTLDTGSQIEQVADLSTIQR